MNDVSGRCWHCGHSLSGTDYGRADRCPGCGRDTRVCRNCRFYRPGMSNDCQEPIADHVADKARANFCDYFAPGDGERTEAPSSDELLAAAEALFRSDD